MEPEKRNLNFEEAYNELQNSVQNKIQNEATAIQQGGGDAKRYRGSSDWTGLGEKILEAAKQELFLAMRYMFQPLNRLSYKRNQGVSCVATDGSSIYYNPLKLSEWYKENPVKVNRAYLHMVFHCLFRNVYGTENKTPELWDLASDIMAEYLIDGIELSCVMLPEDGRRTKIYRLLEERCKIMSAPNIYYALTRFPETQVRQLTAAGLFYVDDHSCWYEKNKQDNEDKRQDSKNDRQDDGKKQWEDAARKMQAAIAAFSQGRGDSKGKLRKVLGAQLSSRTSYKDFLRKFVTVRENIRTDMDSFDYGFYNYGMSIYGNMPLIEELEYREETGIEDFVIVLDTSGSCAYDLLQKFVNVTFDILKTSENFFEKINLHIIQCDNEVQEDTVIHSSKDMDRFKAGFEVKGFGGTDFRPAFHYVDSLRRSGQLKRMKGILYFTDGYGIYPERKPAYDVAFVFMGGFDEDRKVPAWAVRVDIDEEEVVGLCRGLD